MTENRITLEPGLYVTATPIGNLGDITYRAVETLKAADLILCEDTRQTAKLCAAYDIATPRKPYHDHNAAEARPGIIKKLQDGARICLVSDAGTPLISDPGYKLVRAARDVGVNVIPVPGPSAALTALSAAGAPSDKFLFVGFLPPKPAARKKALQSLLTANTTLIFYETAGRLGDSLADMADALGDRRAVVARELTKRFEEFCEGNLVSLADKFSAAPPKGEIVVIVWPPEKPVMSEETLRDFLKEALMTMSVREAATAAADALGIARKTAYARALELKGER